jgi:hypothetical protein
VAPFPIPSSTSQIRATPLLSVMEVVAPSPALPPPSSSPPLGSYWPTALPALPFCAVVVVVSHSHSPMLSMVVAAPAPPPAGIATSFDLPPHNQFDVVVRNMCGSRTGGWSLPCVMSD